jgi:serine/threonine-protein kinase
MVELTSDVPLDLDRIVEMCLRKDPDQRFQSMREVQTLLAVLKRQADSGALDALTMRTIRTIVPPPAKSRSSRAPAVGLAVVLLAAAAVSGGYWWATRHGAPPSPAPIAATPSPDGTLDNDSILAMAQAKVAPGVIISQIRASKTKFNLSAAEVIRLSKAGVPADVIEAMRNPQAEPADTPVATPIVLGDALPIRLNLSEDIPTDAAEGDPVRFRVAHDVRVGNTVVIPKGAEALGSIVDSAKKKLLVFAGKITFRLDTVDAVGDQKVTIRATQARHGDGPSKRPVISAGKSKKVAAAAGGEYLGYIDGSNTVMVKR